jgi:hypothetical protein
MYAASAWLRSFRRVIAPPEGDFRSRGYAASALAFPRLLVTGNPTHDSYQQTLADFPLLIAISERQNTSVSPTIYPELSGTLVIISHIPVSGQ